VVRASDVCARVGGDEFAVAMPETTIERAREVANRCARDPDRAPQRESPESVAVMHRCRVVRLVRTGRPFTRWRTPTLYEDKRRRKADRQSAEREAERRRIRLLAARRPPEGGRG